MKEVSNAELARFINELPPSCEPFEPTAIYDPDGDCIEFLFEADDYYAESIDAVVTAYYSRTTNQLIGSLINGVSTLKKRHPNVFGVIIDDGKVKLGHLFVMAAALSVASDPSNARVTLYQKLIKAADEAQATARLYESVS